MEFNIHPIFYISLLKKKKLGEGVHVTELSVSLID